MPINVAICDDNESITKQLEKYLVDIFRHRNIDCEIDCFFTGEDLCGNLTSGAVYDLVFLDIELPNLNGVEVGDIIRNKLNNEAVSIVYISWNKNYSMDLFDMRPLNFLVKPLDFTKVEKVTDTFLKLAKPRSEFFVYKVKHDTLKVSIGDIMYFENVGKKIRIHTTGGGTAEFYGTLRMIYEEQLIKYDFLPIHAAYIVNNDYVKFSNYNQLTLTDGMVLTISQSRRKEIREMQHAMDRRRI
jgi:DNA-binding LytR/AlgR family response regulator